MSFERGFSSTRDVSTRCDDHSGARIPNTESAGLVGRQWHYQSVQQSPDHPSHSSLSCPCEVDDQAYISMVDGELQSSPQPLSYNTALPLPPMSPTQPSQLPLNSFCELDDQTFLSLIDPNEGEDDSRGAEASHNE